MPIKTGHYFIINVQTTNYAYLPNPNSDEPVQGRFKQDDPGEQWKIINRDNGHHTIMNIGHGQYAASGSRSLLEETVKGREKLQTWLIQKTTGKGQYTISTTDNKIFWGLIDGEQGTPIALGDVPTDRRNWWMFKDVKDAEEVDQDLDNGRPAPDNPTRPGFLLLKERAVPSAFHNSAQHVNPPRCHPNTRVAILDQIYNWISMDLLRKTWIMWMHGAAGAGKSAILHSIADRCEKERIPLASFFFLQTDSTRNSMERFFATLIYQLILIIPQARNDILTIIEQDQHIFGRSYAFQLQTLIINPLLRVQEHFKGFVVFLVDSLDECIEPTQQSELIKLLATVSCSTTPVIFLVASRRESQIEAAFESEEVSGLVRTIALDTFDIEKTMDDIRYFLDQKFIGLKKNGFFRLSEGWPSPPMVKEIVDKSSGQFIFASIVINYISSPDANPAHQLGVVLGTRPPQGPSDNPFTHLDTLYKRIFEQVRRETLDKVRDIIAFAIAIKKPDIGGFLKARQIETNLDILFVKLRAIIECRKTSLKFLHASLPDFLLDRDRSGELYHIDFDDHRTRLICMLLEKVPPIKDPALCSDVHDVQQERFRLNVVVELFDQALPSQVKVSEELRSSFMNYKCAIFSDTYYDRSYYILGPRILEHVKQLDFRDRGKAYRQLVHTFAVEYANNWPLLSDYDKASIVRRAPDLMDHINKIQRASPWKNIGRLFGC